MLQKQATKVDAELGVMCVLQGSTCALVVCLSELLHYALFVRLQRSKTKQCVLLWKVGFMFTVGHRVGQSQQRAMCAY